MTDLERQLVAECAKLINAIRRNATDLHDIADEVEDFIVNNCGDE